MEKTLKLRQSNFELMRIISMFMIVMWHVIISGVGLSQANNTLTLFLDIIKLILVVHVNSFVLVTGYFQSTSKFRLKKVLNLIATSWFYRIVAVIIVLALSLTTLTNLEILNNVFILPLEHEHWFIHYYILLYILSPFFNKFIERSSQGELKKLVLTLVFINCFLPYLTNQGFFSTSFGFSLYHFITLYFIGAYFRKYPLKQSYHFKNMSIKHFRLLMVLIFLGCAFGSLTILYLGKYICSFAIPGSILFEIGAIFQTHPAAYDFPLIVVQSCAYFLFFSTFSFKNKFINNLSTLMIGVYLIHESELLKPYIYKLFPFLVEKYSPFEIILQIFVVACIIFVCSIIIEYFRKKGVELIGFLVKKLKKAGVSKCFENY